MDNASKLSAKAKNIVGAFLRVFYISQPYTTFRIVEKAVSVAVDALS